MTKHKNGKSQSNDGLSIMDKARGKKMLWDLGNSLFQANAPELAGAIGVWYTFKDKPYALALAAAQVTDPALYSSAIGIWFPS